MRRIPVLDGWRGVAIALVIAHHVGQNVTVSEAVYYTQNVTRFGQFGVDIFFGLSGLLITRLLLQEQSDSGTFSLPQFYIRRTFRILPPLLAYLAAFTVLGLWKSNLEFVSSLLFFRNYVPPRVTGFSSGHLWSLAVEEHFYLLWPGLLALSGPRHAKRLASGLALLFGLWHALAPHVAPWLFPEVPLLFRTDVRLDALLWGCLAACLLHDTKDDQKFAALLPMPAWIVAAALLVVSIPFYTALASVWAAVLLPLILVWTLLHRNSGISRVLGWAGLAWLGRISYSLYLWQQLFLPPGWQPTSLWWRHWPWNLVAALTTATLSYYLVEKPLITVGRRLSDYSKKCLRQSVFKHPTATITQGVQ
jgi:peptidoglycan/LPS O-acetylase OafA/YrhL